MLDNEDKALKSMLHTFGSKFSLEDIASAFCRARGDVHIAGELLCGKRTSSSDINVSNGFVKSKTSSKLYNDFSKPLYANGNGDCKALRLKSNPVSTVLGNPYMCRAWMNVNPYGTKPLEIEASKFSGFVYSSGDHLLSQKDYSDASLNKEIENYLFGILGQGFQLERSAIREVLGQCGYDMKESMEALLDLAAVTLDRRNEFDDGSNIKSNSETLSSQNHVPKQICDKSPSRSMGTNGIFSRKIKERYEHQNEVLNASLHDPEQQIFVNRQDEAVEGSYEFLRKAVKEYRVAMKEYYKAAAEAVARSDRARAGILLEKGQFFSNKAREANDESARKIFETSIKEEEIKDEMCLDLQHHDAKEAIRLLRCHLCSLSGIPSIRNLKIILGTGEKDVEKRKRLVKKLLQREAIKWIEDENLGTILVRLDEINPDCLSFTQKLARVHDL